MLGSNTWLWTDLLAMFLCIVFAGFLIPQILLISFRKKLLDEPDARKIHTSAVPRLGGLAFMPVVLFTCVLIIGFNYVFRDGSVITCLLGNEGQFAFVTCAMLLLYLVGMADDLIGVRYRAKFVVQILCAVFMIVGGVWVNNFHGLFGIYELSPWIGMPFTVLLTVFVINAINLIDGVDGLASSLCSIALLVYGVAALLSGQYVYSLLAFCTVGVLIPFFYYNVFGDATRKKKIFMGDTGSLTIGMMIAFLAVHTDMQAAIGYCPNINPCVVAFIPLMIPCVDVVRVYGERLRAHGNPFLPDKRHIHHKLMALGLRQRPVMVTLMLVSLLFTVTNIILSQWVNINILFIADILLWTLAMLALARALRARR